jgi:hypothetical protein
MSWWRYLAGDHRQIRTPLARPFALMRAGEYRAAADEWRALGCPLWSAYEVAGQLFLSEKTVGHHVSAVLRKVGEPTRSRAVAAALRRGIIPPR